MPSYADTHPFDRELAGRHYGFAHNGTIRDFFDLPLGRFQPLGDTDSEWMFCHLLSLIEDRGGELSGTSDWVWLHERLRQLNERGTLNCLLSDGRRLICYHDLTAWKGLTLRQLRFADDDEREFKNTTLNVHVESDVYNSGYVIATVPLSHSGWTSFVPGQMTVLEHGSLVYAAEEPAEGIL
jgi:predicted glutamine amidotransferase